MQAFQMAGVFRRHGSAVLLLALAVIAGCSRAPTGPKRNSLSGAVTVGGKPVPAGRIIFSPDEKKGNAGPGATAFIVKGRYQTPPEHGVVSGPHVVDILGYDDGDDPDSDNVQKASVKKIMNIDVPENGGQYNFTF